MSMDQPADRSGILSDVDRYYSDKLREHGPTTAGVDWNGEESQHLRFKALLNVAGPDESDFSILDYGCGFGSMYAYMSTRWSGFEYTGYDISSTMIAEARELHGDSNAKWVTDEAALGSYDYIVASGIFNVRLEHSDDEWLQYILQTMHWMHEHSRRGFACNLLTSFSDAPFRRDHLYYANPMDLFAHCKTTFSRNVALLHDYDLYDFALIVRKDGAR
jgi:SAM-dependent methyltransferase